MTVLQTRRRDDPRRRETELAFLRATEALLTEGSSYADLNVSRIAERAGRTRTAFYVHFADRRELLMRVVAEFAEESFAAAEPFFAVDAQPAALRGSLGALLQTFRAHAPLVRALVEAAGYDEQIAAFWRAQITRFADELAERLERDGHPPATTPALGAALAWMVERSLVQQVVVAEPPQSDAAVVDALASIIARTLGPTKTTTPGPHNAENPGRSG